MRLGRRFLPLLACLLGACDAGHRANPGADNLWPGPELVVVQPGPGQVVTVPAKGPEATGYETPSIFFDLRNLATEEARKGDRILYSIDGGPVREVTDWSRPVPRAQDGLAAGTHILLACVWSGVANAPYGNPESVVLRRFHVEGESGDWDLWMTAGTPPRAPLEETGPALFVVGPTGTVRGTPQLTFAFKGTGFGTRYRLAYRIDDGEWQVATEVAAIDLKDVAPGKHRLVARLEEAHAGADGATVWKLPPRPFFARKLGKTEPGPGEFNVVARDFVVE